MANSFGMLLAMRVLQGLMTPVGRLILPRSGLITAMTYMTLLATMGSAVTFDRAILANDTRCGLRSRGLPQRIGRLS